MQAMPPSLIAALWNGPVTKAVHAAFQAIACGGVERGVVAGALAGSGWPARVGAGRGCSMMRS